MKLRFLPILALAAGLQLPTPNVSAEPLAGAYLAAQQARFQHDFAAAAEHFSRALARDPSNPALMESAVVSFMSLGDLDKAIPVAQGIADANLRSQAANMTLVADEAKRGDYDAILQRIEDKRGVGELADGLLVAWSYRAKGDMKKSLEIFDEVAAQRGWRGFALYHKALALASVGDYESADHIFSGEADGPLQRTRRSILAWTQVLSQLERNDDALTLLEDAFGNGGDPEIAELRGQLEAGGIVPFSLVTNAQDGIAEVFFSLGRALLNDTSEDYALIYARVAEYLSPGNIEATLMSAEMLETLGQYELATLSYKAVPREHPSFQTAELGRSDALRRSGKVDAAIEVLEQLTQTHGDFPLVHVSAGDLNRQLSKFDAAVTAYNQALEIYEAREEDQWFVYYARGISHERLGQWENAETDFRKALELNPDQPQVLNYLGYSMVEKGINLDEALSMIERAVAARPDSGYIVDSLGWVLYQLDRYEEAVGHMERAAELTPVDPVVNDHLGDVLWAVGRFTEAEFQWMRALSLINEIDDETETDADPERIRRKLDVGLDEVLKEEGSDPLKVVGDGG